MPDVEPSAVRRSLEVELYLPGDAAARDRPDRSNAGSRRAAVRDRLAAVSRTDSPHPRAEILSIAVTMLVTFIVAFGVMYRQRRPESPPNQPQEREAVSRSVPPAPFIAHPVTLPQRVAATEKSNVAATAGAAPQALESAMPVSVSFIQYNQHSAEDDPEKTTPVFVGRVWNRSADPITVDVVRESAGGQSTAQTQLTVDARRMKPFGQNDGVELHAGDTVTLRGDRFADYVVQVH